MIHTHDLPATADQTQIDGAMQDMRAYLSAVADADDDPTTLADDVQVHVERLDDMVRIVGELDAEPSAPYLQPGWDPEDDVRANPLTVPSINEQGGEQR